MDKACADEETEAILFTGDVGVKGESVSTVTPGKYCAQGKDVRLGASLFLQSSRANYDSDETGCLRKDEQSPEYVVNVSGADAKAVPGGGASALINSIVSRW